MSYKNQRVLVIDNPKGLEEAIASIQESLSDIPYLEKVFGRAHLQKKVEKGGQVSTVPVAYEGGKEYTSVLPNDYLKSFCFFMPTGEATPIEFNRSHSNIYQREVSLIFWGNLKKINPIKDYIFTDEIVADFLKILTYHKNVESIIGYTDGGFEEIYEETEISDKFYEGKNQPLMFPYVGIRINMNITYNDSIACDYLSSEQNPE